MSGNETRRQKLEDLRALVNYLTDNPEIPLGSGASLSYHVDADDDAAGVKRLAEIADLIDEAVTDVGGREPNAATTHFYARKAFGSARYEACYITKESHRRYVEHMKPYNEANRARAAAVTS
jgi:hypothetical protein